MSVVVSGSIAVDYLMRFEGRFAELIVPEQIQRLSLSFLVDDLEVRRGGVAANICFGLAQLGLRPVLVAAAGHDFTDYRAWLVRNGVDTGSVHVSDLHHTARFHCTTDLDGNQIASFYTGAMEEARQIELGPVLDRVERTDLVVISPNDPEAMQRHTDEARRRRVPFVADPSQQLARLEGTEIRELVRGAAVLVTNDYERSLLESKTGWSSDAVLEQVAVRVTTLGADGCVIEGRDTEPIRVAAVEPRSIEDPTGVGDGFRAGVLAGRAWGLSWERCAQLGSYLATTVLETVGTQEYTVSQEDARRRLTEAYGEDAGGEIVGRMHAG